MAVVENASDDLALTVESSNLKLDNLSSESNAPTEDQEQSKHKNLVQTQSNLNENNNGPVQQVPHDQSLVARVQQKLQLQNQKNENPVQNGFHHGQSKIRSVHDRSNGGQKDLRELEELFSKLNPMAEEFVPPSLANYGGVYTNNFAVQNNFKTGYHNGTNGLRKNGHIQGRKRMNNRTSMAQREEIIRRTVYVSDVDHQVTEEQLAALFTNCGQVVDCRICGDPNSVLHFAFIEFTNEVGARAALSLAGTMLGYYPVKVLPSKTAIAPVNPTFLPMTEVEREMCVRTIYCTNIDRKVSHTDVRHFFESICGEVLRLRLLGDYHHSTRIAFVEFVMAESAIAALNCSGVMLGSLPIRVSPSKTPVRPRAPRLPVQ